MPDVPAFLTVAADEVGRCQQGNQFGDVSGIILAVAIHHHADVAVGGIESGIDGGALAELPVEGKEADAGMFTNQREGVVFAAIIDGDDFGVRVGAPHFVEDGADVFLFVKKGDDDAGFHKCCLIS